MVFGDDHSAYGVLKRALAVLQQAVAADAELMAPSSRKHPHSTACHENQEEDNPCPLVALPFDCEKIETTLYGTDDDKKSCYYVHSKPFVFEQDALDVANLPIYISIVVFNMTLLLLRKARKDLDALPSLEKALRLYDMALVLLAQAPAAGSTNLMVAVLNNKVHVCYCLHRFGDAHASLASLTELLTSILSTETPVVFHDIELNEMILNTILPADPTRFACAA